MQNRSRIAPGHINFARVALGGKKVGDPWYILFTVQRVCLCTDLKLFGPPTGGCLGDLLQLLDALTEVCHPLDHSHGGWHCVAAPAAWQNACSQIQTVQ